MAVLAKGFDETLNEMDWTLGAPGWGVPYCVTEGMALTASTSSAPRVGVGAGVATVYGVRVQITASEPRDLTVPTSGSRWDLLALRVNWQTNQGSVVVVQGGSSKTLPAGRQQSPGVIFDMPLMLARVQVGENRIMEWVDLRLGASKLISSPSALALPPGVFGGRARVGDVDYASDGATWSVVPEVPAVRLTGGNVIREWRSGWGYGDNLGGPWAIVEPMPGGGKDITLTIQTRKYNPAFLFDQYGGAGDIEIGRVVTALEPGRWVQGRAIFWGGRHGDTTAFYTNGCDMILNGSGGIIITGGAPPYHQITRRLTDEPSLEVTFNYKVLP